MLTNQTSPSFTWKTSGIFSNLLLSLRIFFVRVNKMVKKTDPKLYKFTRKTIDEDKNNLVLRFKNLSTKQIRELKSSLNDFIVGFFDKEEVVPE